MTDPKVLAVRDFILSQSCTPCNAVLRRRPEFDALIAHALQTAKDERVIGVFAAVGFYVLGAVSCALFFLLHGGIR